MKKARCGLVNFNVFVKCSVKYLHIDISQPSLRQLKDFSVLQSDFWLYQIYQKILPTMMWKSMFLLMVSHKLLLSDSKDYFSSTAEMAMGRTQNNQERCLQK